MTLHAPTGYKIEDDNEFLNSRQNSLDLTLKIDELLNRAQRGKFPWTCLDLLEFHLRLECPIVSDLNKPLQQLVAQSQSTKI